MGTLYLFTQTMVAKGIFTFKEKKIPMAEPGIEPRTS
jgi:hypothetical protein